MFIATAAFTGSGSTGAKHVTLLRGENLYRCFGAINISRLTALL
jgi:hypothetical protein